MAAESFLVRALSTLIAEFNRRDLHYALAGGWAYSALVEPRRTSICFCSLNSPLVKASKPCYRPSSTRPWSILPPWCSKEFRYGVQWAFAAVKMWLSIFYWRIRIISRRRSPVGERLSLANSTYQFWR